MSLGENIYNLRTAKKLSQEDFAAAMEVSRQSVSKWENDIAVPELEKLIKMAKLFEVSLDELVGNTPPQEKSEPTPIVASGDLISAVLLLLGSILPFCALFLADLLGSSIIIIAVWCVIPPLAVIGASLSSTKNKQMHWAFLVYTIVFGILQFLFARPYSLFPIILEILFVEDWGRHLK